MAKVVCKRAREQRARQEDPIEEVLSSFESEEDAVTLSNNNSEGEYEGTTTPSQPDDDLESSPPATGHRPVTRSMPRKPTSRPKQKAYKTRTELGSSSKKLSRG